MAAQGGWCGWLMLALVGCFSAKAAAEVQTLRISSGEFPPWTGEHLPGGGYVNQLVQEAFATQGVTVEFVYLPWQRAFDEARQGRVDATSYWYANSERHSSMLFSEPLVVNRTVFFQRANEPLVPWQQLQDRSKLNL